MELIKLAELAKKSAAGLSIASSGDKDRAIHAIAEGLLAGSAAILEANAADLAAAEQNGMSAAMMDRLRLTRARVEGIAASVKEVAALPDPVGRVLDGSRTAGGLQITRIAVPLGVVGVIFESRPNVTVDCAVLCLKSGNACVLRGGKEAIHSNQALVESMRGALAGIGFDPECIQLVTDTSRETASEMMRLNGYIDVLIPRGGPGLISSVVKNATVPVIETGVGNCHVYVDASAKPEMAADIVDNAKTSRPSVCNAMETLLIHGDCAEGILPLIAKRLKAHQVELRGCQRSREILSKAGFAVKSATREDYATEFADYILAIRVVESLEEAIDHIGEYSTRHSDAIVTEDYENARVFTSRVDSAAVYVNASTRFTDGGEFGLGAEIGISTQKLHARGPMGLAQLTSWKYIVHGNGQIR